MLVSPNRPLRLRVADVSIRVGCHASNLGTGGSLLLLQAQRRGEGCYVLPHGPVVRVCMFPVTVIRRPGVAMVVCTCIWYSFNTWNKPHTTPHVLRNDTCTHSSVVYLAEQLAAKGL